MKGTAILIIFMSFGCGYTWDDFYKDYGHGYGANPPDPMCQWNFTLKNYETAGMQECNIDEMISDFEDYIVYVRDLVRIGERTYEPLVYSVPDRLYKTKGVFCFEHCSTIPYVKGLCHHWEDDHRKTRQRDKERAAKEIEKDPRCAERWKDFKAHTPIRIQYNWKATDKYRKWKNGTLGYRK